MIKKYKTIYEKGQAEIVEKKSRFIANMMPVMTEDEAIQFVESIKKKYYNATHNVYAYVVGYKNELQRYSDDGEPSGTAGMPILNVLKGQDIKNVVIVVTRYFGGTLLGTGGLVRAYSKSAKKGLETIGIIEKRLYQHISIEVEYTISGKVQYVLNEHNYIIKDTIYTELVTYNVLVYIDDINIFEKQITEVTKAKANIEYKHRQYCAIINNKIELLECPH